MSLINRASLAVEELIDLRRDIKAAVAGRAAGQTDRLVRAGMKVEAAAREIYPTLEHAEPYWWERPILEVIEVASASLPEWTVRAEMFPSFSGFFLFSRPIGGVRDPLEAMSGVSWVREGTGALIATYGQLEDVYLIPLETVRAEDGGRWDVNAEDPEAARRRLLIFGACLLFLEQRLALSSVERVDRSARRRFEKAEIAYPPLRVIKLRTSDRLASDGALQAVDWQFRWLVRGHWRQQFYASDGSHRPLWITPYVKGPDDKPLKTPAASVFAVVR